MNDHREELLTSFDYHFDIRLQVTIYRMMIYNFLVPKLMYISMMQVIEKHRLSEVIGKLHILITINIIKMSLVEQRVV